MEQLQLQGKDHIKLCDLLAVMGWCENAGIAKHIIDSGKVKLDGQVELRKSAKVTSNQLVEYDGKSVKVI